VQIWNGKGILSHEILIVIILVWARECLRDTGRRADRQEGCLACSQKFSKACLQDDGQACRLEASRLAASRLAGKQICRKACKLAGRLAGWRKAC
jgi:hypothetical protein